jgi:Glyoxalase-like domain
MTTTTIAPAVAGLHHLGHVVRDPHAAATVYRRLGFHVPAFEFPALPAGPGQPVRTVGPGNTHIAFPRTFIELVTVGAPDPGARLVPLDAPPGMAPRLVAGIAATTRRLQGSLDRFEGLHILVFEAAGTADAAVARLAAHGVTAGAVQRLRRTVETADRGEMTVPIGFVEIDSDAGRSPEGRLAVAEALPPNVYAAGPAVDHPNGVVELAGAVLCVPDAELAAYERRYERYLEGPARPAGTARVFTVGTTRVMLVTPAAVDDLLPGERPPALPAFVAAVVRVGDLAATREVLDRSTVPVRPTTTGGLFVPAAAALGAAIVFEPATD